MFRLFERMKVVCINNVGSNKKYNLTLGKIYDIVANYGDSYLIVNDIGKLVDYASFRFETLVDYRDRIIEKLGIKI
jgi:hypothetical protein